MTTLSEERPRLTIAELDKIEQRAARRARVTLLCGVLGALAFIYLAQWLERHGIVMR